MNAIMLKCDPNHIQLLFFSCVFSKHDGESGNEAPPVKAERVNKCL